MALFGLSSNKNVSDLIKKSKSVKKSETTLQKGGSLFTKIKNTCQLVESKLGHYAKELQLIQTKEALQEYITAAINNDIIDTLVRSLSW